jgi:hypothetical protein
MAIPTEIQVPIARMTSRQERDDQPEVTQRLREAPDGQAQAHGGHAPDHEREDRHLGDDFEPVRQHVHLHMGAA